MEEMFKDAASQAPQLVVLMGVVVVFVRAMLKFLAHLKQAQDQLASVAKSCQEAVTKNAEAYGAVRSSLDNNAAALRDNATVMLETKVLLK